LSVGSGKLRPTHVQSHGRELKKEQEKFEWNECG